MKKYQSFSHGNSLTGGTGRNGSGAAATSMITNKRLRRSNNKLDVNGGHNNKKKKKGAHDETFTQALLYVTAYFLCVIFVIIAQFIEKVSFPLMLLKAIFYPSQGK